MSELDDFIAQEQVKGKLPVPPPPQPVLSPKVPADNELDAFIHEQVAQNPLLLDNDAPIKAPTSFENIAPGTAKLSSDPTEGIVEKSFRRGLSEVTRAAGSLGRLPGLVKGALPYLNPMNLLPIEGLNDVQVPETSPRPGVLKVLDTLDKAGREVEKDIDARQPMSDQEIAQFDRENPVLGTALSATGQLASLYLIPTTSLKLASSLTLGADEQAADVAAVERETGIPINEEARLTAEMLGAATGVTDILPYWHAMKGLFRRLPNKAYTALEKKMEKWWRAQAVGARYGAETLSVAVSEGLQEGFQGWGQDLTARDWVGYDPSRDPMDTLAANVEGGFGAGVVFDALLKVLNRRGLKTLRAEDRAYQLKQDAEGKQKVKERLESIQGEAPTLTPEIAQQRVEYLGAKVTETEGKLSTATALLQDAKHVENALESPSPSYTVFERQASRAVDFFEPLEQVTISDLNRYIAIVDPQSVNEPATERRVPSEVQLVSELYNKMGSGTTGKAFARALQGQLFPLVGVEFGPQQDTVATHGMSILWGQNVPGTAVSWESPWAMAAQDVRHGEAVARSHVFTSRAAGREAFEEAQKRALMFRLGHIRYALDPYDGVPYIIEVQTDRIPQTGRVEPRSVLGYDTIQQATKSQEGLLKGEVNQRGLRYLVRNQMAKFSSEGHKKFSIIHPDHLTRVHGVRPEGITHNSYRLLAEWLQKNFQTVEYYTPNGNIKSLMVQIPDDFHRSEIPFGADLRRPLKQVQTPYVAHADAVNNIIQRLVSSETKELLVFKTDQLRKQAQALREELRQTEREVRRSTRYYAIKKTIKDLEFEIRSKEAGARRLNTILNWSGHGRPPGTPGYNEKGFDSLDRDTINWAMENFGTFMDLAYNNKHIKPLQDIAQYLWFKHADMMQHVHQAIETVKALDGLKDAQRQILFKVMMQSVIDSRDAEVRFTDSALVKELKAAGATPKTIEVYLRVRGDFSRAIDTLRGALVKNLENNFKREGKWDKLLNAPAQQYSAEYLKRATAIDENLDKWRQVEYFPFLRFGEWKVRVTARGAVVKDNNSFLEGETVEFMQFPTEGEARAAMRELQEIYASQNVTVEIGKQVQSPFAVSTGVPEGFMAQLTQKLDLSEEQKHRLFELSAKTAPSKSFIQRYLKKKLVSGYSQDGVRAYADYFYSFASYISNLKFDHLIDLGRAELRASTEPFKQGKVVDTTKRDRIIQFVEYHIDRLRANQNEFATLRQIGTFWYLGFVPKTVFVNMLQVPMILYPYLRTKYGEAAAGKIGDAYGGQIGNAILSAMKRVQKVQGKTPLNEDVGLNDILGFLYESGKLNQSFLTELAAATSEDRIKAFSIGRAKRYWHEAVAFSMMPFQLMEELNRRVTVEAIYRLEMETRYPGKSWANLQPSERRRVREAAIEGLDKTMFEYGRWNRAKFQQGWKSPVFLFYGYMQGLLSFLATDPANKRAILLFLIIGGLEGLPFFGNLLDVLDTLLVKSPAKFKELWGDLMMDAGVSPQTAGVPDLRGQLRDLLMQLTSGDAGMRDFMMNGLSKTYGLGPFHLLKAFDINVPEIDISGSLSVGRLIPGTDKIRQAVLEQDGGKAWEGLLEAVAGPLGNAASGVTQAMLDNDIDTWKQLEKALPTFAKGISTGIRREIRGGETRNVTDVTIPTDTAQNIAAGLSFRPTQVAKEQTVMWQTYERKLYFAGWRRGIFNEVERWVRSNDIKAEDGGEMPPHVLREIERFNKHAPGGYKIGREALIRSLRDRLKSGAREAAIGVEEVKDLELMQEVERLVGSQQSSQEPSGP